MTDGIRADRDLSKPKYTLRTPQRDVKEENKGVPTSCTIPSTGTGTHWPVSYAVYEKHRTPRVHYQEECNDNNLINITTFPVALSFYFIQGLDGPPMVRSSLPQALRQRKARIVDGLSKVKGLPAL